MKPLPDCVLRVLEALPEETSKIILNTNRHGQWVIEVFTRYKVEESLPEQAVLPFALQSSSHTERR